MHTTAFIPPCWKYPSIRAHRHLHSFMLAKHALWIRIHKKCEVPVAGEPPRPPTVPIVPLIPTWECSWRRIHAQSKPVATETVEHLALADGVYWDYKPCALPRKDLTDSSPREPTAPTAPSPSPTSSKKKGKRPENKRQGLQIPILLHPWHQPCDDTALGDVNDAAASNNLHLDELSQTGDDTNVNGDRYLSSDLALGDLGDFDLGPLGEIGSGEIPDWLTAYIPCDLVLLDTTPNVSAPIPDLVLDQSTAALVPPPTQRHASYKGAAHAPTVIAPAHIGRAATSAGGSYLAFLYISSAPSIHDLHINEEFHMHFDRYTHCPPCDFDTNFNPPERAFPVNNVYSWDFYALDICLYTSTCIWLPCYCNFNNRKVQPLIWTTYCCIIGT
ncbi:hypothetical protein C8R44DRAFT_891378 [Mycena epipterygia]|nr:hypothetical protein C8R44DRAFT_891378 [Mycena epipterygia]